MALPVFVCGAACADCLAANAKGGGFGGSGGFGLVWFGPTRKCNVLEMKTLKI